MALFYRNFDARAGAQAARRILFACLVGERRICSAERPRKRRQSVYRHEDGWAHILLRESIGMQETYFERLSALDATFLDVEAETAPMHVGAALLFDAKPLTLEHGGLDIARLTKYTQAALDSIPRYRQRVEWVPGLGHPVWVDDHRFNMQFHLRHTRLPMPGDLRSLKRLVGRLFSQHLDRSRPLWEFWVVEGVEGDRFALVVKVHHCMVDGVAGVQLLEALLQIMPNAQEREPKDWSPRQLPSRIDLMRSEVKHRVDGLRELSHYMPRVRENFQGLRRLLTSGMKLSLIHISEPTRR